MRRFDASHGSWVLWTIGILALAVGAGGAAGADGPTLVGHWKTSDSKAPTDFQAMSSDGALLATAGSEGGVYVWDVHQGKVKYRLESVPAPSGDMEMIDDTVLRPMAFSADGKVLAVLDHHEMPEKPAKSEKVRVWDAERGTLACQINVPKLSVESNVPFLAALTGRPAPGGVLPQHEGSRSTSGMRKAAR